MTTKVKVIIGGLALLVGLLSYSWFQSNRLLKIERQRVSHYYEMFTANEAQKDSIQARADSIQVVLNRYQYLIDSLETIIVTNHSQITYLKKGLKKALEEAETVPYDDNYVWLQERHTTTDTLEYPFSGPQVKSITKEVLSYIYVDSLYRSQIDISILQQAQLGYSQDIIETLQVETDYLNNLVMDLYNQLEAQLKEAELKEIDRLRLKKALRVWRLGAVTGGAFVVLALIL